MIEKKLLCATDGSHESEKAVAYAIEFVKKCGGKLAFLTVDSLTSEQAAHTYFWDSKLLKAGDALVHNELGAARRAAEAAGLQDVACLTTNGRDPAEAIVAYAEAHGYDHIVLGSAGRTGLNRLMLGSVAQAVVVKARCPVTIVR
jgi:nucleotide-binding universal stress UspA family protein